MLAEINVKLNFDTRVIESVEFAPPANGTEGLAVSMKELIEAISSGSEGGVAGIDANVRPSQYLAALDEDSSALYYNISREANYEINETKTQIEQAKGQIEELSVSVIISSEEAEDYSQDVVSLIATAIGVDQQRITVAMLPFVPVQESQEFTQAMLMQQEIMTNIQGVETLRLVIIAAASLIVLIFLFAIIRMFKKSVMR